MSDKAAELDHKHGARAGNGIKVHLLMPRFEAVLEGLMRCAACVANLQQDGPVTSPFTRNACASGALNRPLATVWQTPHARAHVCEKLRDIMLL